MKGIGLSKDVQSSASWRVLAMQNSSPLGDSLKKQLHFVKGFPCIYWDNHMVFIFQFVNVVYYTDWFADIKESLHPWDKPHLVMIYDLF